jgi:hypothetical protein
MITFNDVKIDVQAVSVELILEDNLTQSCNLTVKSKLFFEIAGNEIIKDISNTVQITDKKIISLFRNENNKEVLKEFVKKII